jgi:hypothetical protein
MDHGWTAVPTHGTVSYATAAVTLSRSVGESNFDDSYLPCIPDIVEIYRKTCLLDLSMKAGLWYSDYQFE